MNIPVGTLPEHVQRAARGQALRQLAVVCCVWSSALLVFSEYIDIMVLLKLKARVTQ